MSVENIRVSGNNVPKKIYRVVDGALKEVNKVYKAVGGTPVLVWERGGGNITFTFEITFSGAAINFGQMYANTSYTYDIDWGDGTVDAGVAARSGQRHTYQSAGTYTVHINNYAGGYMGSRFISTSSSNQAFLVAATFGVPLEFATGVFKGCYNLRTVQLAAGTNVSQDLFRDCSALTSINLGVVSGIGQAAFNGCISLRSINIPAGITVGNGAFEICQSLTHVNIPYCNLGTGVFRGCSSLSSYSWGGMALIPDSTFMGTNVSLNIGNVSVIGSNAFNSCRGLGSTITIPANITQIQYYAFGNTGVTEIYVMKNRGELSGQPWGATGATVHFLDDDEEK